MDKSRYMDKKRVNPDISCPGNDTKRVFLTELLFRSFLPSQKNNIIFNRKLAMVPGASQICKANLLSSTGLRHRLQT